MGRPDLRQKVSTFPIFLSPGDYVETYVASMPVWGLIHSVSISDNRGRTYMRVSSSYAPEPYDVWFHSGCEVGALKCVPWREEFPPIGTGGGYPGMRNHHSDVKANPFWRIDPAKFKDFVHSRSPSKSLNDYDDNIEVIRSDLTLEEIRNSSLKDPDLKDRKERWVKNGPSRQSHIDDDIEFVPCDAGQRIRGKRAKKKTKQKRKAQNNSQPKLVAHYQTLGVRAGQRFSTIRKAYRRLARKYHPDLNPDNPKVAEERFKEISEAYRVIREALGK